ncbi:hypothetical protein GCM10027265_21940 [Jatrophihabitans fulvus]
MARYRPGRTAALGLRAACVYPGCAGEVERRPDAAGRKALFCGADCRANFYNIQRQLIIHIQRINRLCSDDSLTSEEVTELRQARHLAEWHLQRFRPLAKQEQVTGGPQGRAARLASTDGES